MSTPQPFDLHTYSEERANCEPWNWYRLNDFVKAGFEPQAAQGWLDADVSPDDARHFTKLGMSPAQAWEWAMRPQLVQSYHECGFEIAEAWDWANVEIWGHEAMFWRHGGYTPQQAWALRRVTTPASVCVLWALTGLPADDALEHAEHGANPADFLHPPVADLDEDAEAPYLDDDAF